MIHYKNYDYESLAKKPLRVIRDNRGIEYINIEAALDIETTSLYYQGEKASFMYIWMVGIGLHSPIAYGRTWEELKDFLARVSKTLGLDESTFLPIYVHNLGYEFQFMRGYFEWLDVFATDERKPIKAKVSEGIEFRDSLILSGYSLENTANNLVKYKVKKLVGNLDYNLVRTSETQLTKDELAYCENDVVIILSYIREQLDQYKMITKIPMTNTGRVRNYVKNECYYSDSNHKKSSRGKYSRYRSIMNDLTIDSSVYKQLRRAFMGGFTHASNRWSGEVIEGVDSIDLTSSYPTVMISELFPMSRARPLKAKSYKQLMKLARKHCLLIDVKFKGLSNKLGYESYLSESRCYNVSKPVIDNGRIFNADELTTTITDVDLEIIERVYSWEEMYISNVQGFVKGRLPKPIIKSILDLYTDKTELKGVEGKEIEYLLSKGMLNSIYGMSVTDVLRDTHLYENGWIKEPIDIEKTIEEYNESRNRFLYYPWGVWVTAYARRNLWTAINALGSDYVYADTDSVKMINYEKHASYISKYNQLIKDKLETAVKEVGLDVKQLSPCNNRGERKPLGIWEHEGHYNRFKTLGAKRYLYQQGEKFNLVVAGLSKAKGMEYIARICNNDSDEVFSMFDDNLYIPANETGKMTHTYIDDPISLVVTDYKGKTSEVHTLSGIHLEPCDFTLSVSNVYRDFLAMLSKGYAYRGLKTI